MSSNEKFNLPSTYLLDVEFQLWNKIFNRINEDVDPATIMSTYFSEIMIEHPVGKERKKAYIDKIKEVMKEKDENLFQATLTKIESLIQRLSRIQSELDERKSKLEEQYRDLMEFSQSSFYQHNRKLGDLVDLMEERSIRSEKESPDH